MCVVNKQFELLEFVFESVYVDLQYDEISLTFTAGSVCLCGVCSPVVVVVGAVVAGAVVAVTVMHALLFVLHVYLLRDCKGAMMTAMLVWSPGEVWVAVSAYMGGTRGSGVLASAGDVLERSVVRGVGGVCDMCMCLARGGMGGVGGDWVTGLGSGFTNSGGT